MAVIEKQYLDYEGLSILVEQTGEQIAASLQEAKTYADGLADNYDAAGTAETKVNALKNGQVKTNTDAIATLNGVDTVDGSVAKQIKDATTALREEISTSAYDDTALKGRISANETAIATLNGTGAGSVKKQIDDAFNDFATKVSDDGVTNTYKELIDYCATHSAEAAEMAGDIAKNKTAIAALETFVGKLPEGTSAKTVIDYVNAKVAAVDFSDAIATAKTEAISTAATDATTKANKALADAKDYADGLAGNYATAAQGVKADSALQKADIVEGTTNGAISVKGAAVKVHGLGSAAYTDSTDYATSAQGSKADSAVQSVTSGKTNGTVSVDGTDVAVKGLGTAAYAATSAFDAAGSANAVKTALDTYKTSNDTAVDTLETKVAALEGVTYIPITSAQIKSLFATA